MAEQQALRILERLLEDACDEAVFPAIIQEKLIRAKFGPAKRTKPAKGGELVVRSAVVSRPGVDMYGQERSNEIKYFTCTNCDRQISGNRFAAHVAKCVSRGTRQRSTFT